MSRSRSAAGNKETACRILAVGVQAPGVAHALRDPQGEEGTPADVARIVERTIRSLDQDPRLQTRLTEGATVTVTLSIAVMKT